MRKVISDYGFRIMGESNFIELEASNRKGAWIESRNHINAEIILFERQTISVYGINNNTERSIYYHVPIYHGLNKYDMPQLIKRSESNKNVSQLKLTDLTNIKI